MKNRAALAGTIVRKLQPTARTPRQAWTPADDGTPADGERRYSHLQPTE